MLESSPLSIISLNTWAGRLYDPLMEFLKSHQETNIFCFQETFHQATNSPRLHQGSRPDIYTEIAQALPEHTGYFSPVQQREEGLAIFTKNVEVVEQGSQFIYRWMNALVGTDSRTLGRILQYVKIIRNGQLLTVANIHGLWNGQGKTDSPDRLAQSRKIQNFIDAADSPVILCGDFNLDPDTESLAIIEQRMVNLIKANGITNTRSQTHYTKPGRFADYAFVNPTIPILDFKVLPDEVSDHLPLYLKIA